MSSTLRSHFFPPDPPPIDPSLPTDPLPLPPHPLPVITTAEVSAALTPTSNSSAPGPSGIGYKLLKWAFAASPTHFTSLFTTCLTVGVHPWHDAIVVMVPKPGKPDYTEAKAYRPIALLETCRKLLEKIVTNRLLADLNSLSLLSPLQFGSHNYSSAVDRAAHLAHLAQSTVTFGHVASAIFFDIQGFFDNLHPSCLLHTFHLLSFPPSLITWMALFLQHRSASLSFNSFTSPSFPLTHGTPQGSPLSPLLSAIYTAPLLSLLSSSAPSSHSSFQLYVDDGCVIASGAMFRHLATLAAKLYERTSTWLKSVGLRLDPSKTEFMHFHGRRSTARFGTPVSRLGVRDACFGELSLPARTLVRYLGIFFTPTLSWNTHVSIMASRARSTLAALSLLGNSVRGLDFANWQKVFHACLLPMLTYGSPIW
jgi:Reverse transcriptase (RNA-dependent DNA polymerase)